MNIHGLYLLIMKHVSSPVALSGRIESLQNCMQFAVRTTFLISTINSWTSLFPLSKQHSMMNFLLALWIYSFFHWKYFPTIVDAKASIFKRLCQRNAAGESFIASLSFESTQNIFTAFEWSGRKSEAFRSLTCYRTNSFNLLLRKCNKTLWVSINCAT